MEKDQCDRGRPVFNFILALIGAVIITAWIGIDKPVVAAVDENYPAAEAGLEAEM